MPIALQALFWGLLSGSALLVGAAMGWWMKLPARIVAGVMAFGAGVLISALAFELMQEADERGGFVATAVGFVAGAVVYSVANVVVSRRGGHQRKRSGQQQAKADVEGSATALAIGALIDGVPESIVIGISLLEGGAVSVVTVVAVFLSNVPEGLSSAAGMKNAGRAPKSVFALWGGIAVVSGVAALAGYTLFRGAPDAVVAGVTGVAAGSILAMISDTMLPEASEQTHDFTGLFTVAGFLAAYALSHLAP